LRGLRARRHAAGEKKKSPMEDKFFRQLNPDEEEQFRRWARDNFDPNIEPEPIWHPVVRDEWKKLVEAAGGHAP